MIYYPLLYNYLELYDIKIKKSFTLFEDLWSGLTIILKNITSDVNIYNISSFNTTIEELGNYISNKFKELHKIFIQPNDISRLLNGDFDEKLPEEIKETEEFKKMKANDTKRTYKNKKTIST